MNILIIEDDPMVEFIHRNYLEKINLFETIYAVNSAHEARLFLQEKTVELLLLDIHLKDGNGIDLLQWIREEQITSEVIVISAATEKTVVQKSLHLGIIDYLIKPFTFERFKQSIDLYQLNHQKFPNETIQQAEIDQMFHATSPTAKLSIEETDSDINEKGITKATYERILEVLKQLPQPFTIQDVVDKSGLSHVSIRKYISYLEREQKITSKIIYVKVGRPYRLFTYSEV